MNAPDRLTALSGISPGITIRAEPRPPRADWLCRCGRHERAIGRDAVIELASRATVTHCPHT
ncbi:hypothetical protein AQ490_06090 [Wenjunlia vitaminophila]|uniref:Uncharacterized protein n=1 Tax=Wenjunlia vitaminophila TaxID=76728 RepID=A0A0T6LN87_WENVI|nr:hypothetical protein [Wenjunlia vitaminophila]KRV47477.1 hypothetical protein AQ490_06090 [Wenjunlia vitaminophila]